MAALGLPSLSKRPRRAIDSSQPPVRLNKLAQEICARNSLFHMVGKICFDFLHAFLPLVQIGDGEIEMGAFGLTGCHRE